MTNSISLVLIVRTVSILFIGIVDEYLKDRHAVLSFRVGIVSVSGFAVFLELIVNGHGLFYSRMVLLNIADHKGKLFFENVFFYPPRIEVHVVFKFYKQNNLLVIL